MTGTSLEHLVYTFTITLYHFKAFYFPYHNLELSTCYMWTWE